MAELILDLSGRGGLATSFHGNRHSTTPTPENIYLGGATQYAGGVCSPLRRYGYLSPIGAADTATTTSDAFTGEMVATVYNHTQDDIIFVENGPYIYKLDTVSDLSFSTQITALQRVTSSEFTDITLYQLNGVAAYYAAYTVGTSHSNVAMTDSVDNFSANYDNDFLSTIPTGFFTLPDGNTQLRVADNGFMYILNNNKVHKFDGTTDAGATGEATEDVLVFPASHRIKDAVDYRGRMYFAIRENSAGQSTFPNISKCGIYVWNRVSTVASLSDYIPVPAKAIHKIYVTQSGRIRIIVTSNSGFTEIREYNGSAFKTIVTFDRLAYPRYVGSVKQVDDLTIISCTNGDIYAHGTPFIGEPEGLYQIGSINSLVSDFQDRCSAIYYGDTSNDGLYLSYRNTSLDFDVIKYFPFATGTVGSVANFSDVGNFYSLVKFLPKLSNVSGITINCVPTTSDDTTIATVKVFINQNTTEVRTHTIKRSEASKGYVYIPIDDQYVNSIQIKIEWATNISTDQFEPSYAKIDYTPTTTLK